MKRLLTLITAVLTVTSMASVVGAGAGRAAVTATSWHVGLTVPAVTTNSDYLSCGSATQCQSVGATFSGSSAMASTNGGRTWARESVPPSIAGLGPVSCGSATACQMLTVTTANTFAIIGTGNAGKTWTTEAIPSHMALSALSCANATDCQAGAQITLNGDDAMLGTSDGGRTWRMEGLPSPLGQVYGVSCGSATSCQAVASTASNTGAIYTTSNGGKTWTTGKSLGTTIMYVVDCASASSCQALGETPANTSVVLGTTDGGKTWNTERLPGSEFPTVVSCSSPSRCLAAGQTPTGVFTASTVNAGKTWANVAAPAGFSAINALSCHTGCVAAGEAATGIGAFAASRGGGWTAGRLPTEFYSLNALACPAGCLAAGASEYGGAAITAVAGGQLPPVGAQEVASSGSLSGAACNGATCVVTGENGGWLSADGGKTWKAQRMPANLDAVSCGSPTGCVTVGTGATANDTTNGGKSWHPALLPHGIHALTGVSCGSAADCLAIGETRAGGPLVMRSDNSGRSWTVSTAPAGAGALASVSCRSGASCHVAGQTPSGGAIELNTTDGGKVWSAGKLPAGVTSVTGLACASLTSCDALAGTATGQNEILATTDAGLTWTAQPVPAAVTGLTAIACRTTGCVVAGTDAAGDAVVLLPGPGSAAALSVAHKPVAPRAWAHTFRMRAAAPRASVPAGYKAISLNWISSQQGWVLGTVGCGVAHCSEVLATSDGGRSWTVAGTVPAPTPPAGGGPGVTKIAFTTPEDGWTFGPDLYSTADGGQSWTPRTIPGGDKQVLTLATDTAGTYILTSPCAAGTTCTPRHLTLWRQTGTSWTKVPVTIPASSAPVLAVYGKTVYAGGLETSGAANFLFASTDGVHFATRPQPCAASQALALTSIAPTSASKFALLCDGNPGLSQAVKTAYLSADTGKTYRYAGQLGNIGIQAQLVESPSGNLAVAASSDGSFIYINDSRSTAWTMPVGIGDGGLGWGDIQYLTDNQAWVVYSPGNEVDSLGKLLVTRDAGRHWTIAPLG
jgi:photosystem II stability/assembly factor-like uncharacterized protein